MRNAYVAPMLLPARGLVVQLASLGAAVVSYLTLSARPLRAEECVDCSMVDESPPSIPTLGTRSQVAEVQTFGVAGALTRRQFENESARDASVLVSASHFSYDTRTIFSGRSYGFGFIGGGSAGFEGGLGVELAFGLRLPFEKTHGPIARIGIEGFLMGNQSFYSSMLELPKGEFGYQLLDRSLLFEVAATAGPVLAGRFNVEGAPKHPLGGLFQVGGHLAFGARPLHLELGVRRLGFGDSGQRDLDEVTSSLCGLPSVFTICADVRYLADGVGDEEPGARVAYLGVRLGVITSATDPPRANGTDRQKRR
jgi:hypothetical protein